MEFDIENDIGIFGPILERRQELSVAGLKKDLSRYYLPYVEKISGLHSKLGGNRGIIVGVSAIQGAGKTTQGEILEILLDKLGFSSVHLSIDDHYLTHDQLNDLRAKDPRYIRRGVTHDIPLAISDLMKLREMADGQPVEVTQYDKSAFGGDGDRTTPRKVTKKPHFIFYDGWMLGARRVVDESVFAMGLPALERAEDQEFAREINRRLDEYLPLWGMIDFMNVLYVPNYRESLVWRELAEEKLQAIGKGMSKDEVRDFVYYFWRSVHPAIQIRNLAFDETNAQQVAIIGDDHLIKDILTPVEARAKYG